MKTKQIRKPAIIAAAACSFALMEPIIEPKAAIAGACAPPDICVTTPVKLTKEQAIDEIKIIEAKIRQLKKGLNNLKKYAPSSETQGVPEKIYRKIRLHESEIKELRQEYNLDGRSVSDQISTNPVELKRRRAVATINSLRAKIEQLKTGLRNANKYGGGESIGGLSDEIKKKIKTYESEIAELAKSGNRSEIITLKGSVMNTDTHSFLIEHKTTIPILLFDKSKFSYTRTHLSYGFENGSSTILSSSILPYTIIQLHLSSSLHLQLSDGMLKGKEKIRVIIPTDLALSRNSTIEIKVKQIPSGMIRFDEIAKSVNKRYTAPIDGQVEADGLAVKYRLIR